MTYKPHLGNLLGEYVRKKYGEMETLTACCFNSPRLEEGICILTPCTTCAGRYLKDNPGCSSAYILSELAENTDFPFPDYGGARMSIQDTCSARTSPDYLDTIRKFLARMNITLVEPEKTGAKAKCCGQVFYGKTDTAKVESLMKARADEMPCEDVVVYCASCIMSMTVGGKKPRYILDLLFGEPTSMEGENAVSWNTRLAACRKG